MNFNKVNVITNELSNTKDYIPVGEIKINPETDINTLLQMVVELQKNLIATNNSLATFKKEANQKITALQVENDKLLTLVQTNKNLTTAEIANIKESIKLLGGVL